MSLLARFHSFCNFSVSGRIRMFAQPAQPVYSLASRAALYDSKVGYSPEQLTSSDKLVELFESWSWTNGTNESYFIMEVKMSRFKIFRENVMYIERGNKEKTSGDWLGLNKFMAHAPLENLLTFPEVRMELKLRKDVWKPRETKSVEIDCLKCYGLHKVIAGDPAWRKMYSRLLNDQEWRKRYNLMYIEIENEEKTSGDYCLGLNRFMDLAPVEELLEDPNVCKELNLREDAWWPGKTRAETQGRCVQGRCNKEVEVFVRCLGICKAVAGNSMWRRIHGGLINSLEWRKRFKCSF